MTEYDPAEGLYWDEPVHQITLLYDNGKADIYGMSLTDAPALGLTTSEGGGDYVPFEEYDESTEED